MDKKSKIILILFGVVMIGIIVTEIVRPRPLNWRPSFVSSSKIPFGCFVLYNELSDIFDEAEIETVDGNTYEFLSAYDDETPSTFLFVNDFMFFDEQETYQLLDYVKEGNTAFIASKDMGYILRDTLNLVIQSEYYLQENEAVLDFTNTNFKNQTYTFDRGMQHAHIIHLDTLNTEVLGHISFTREAILETEAPEKVRKPNFIKVAFGDGNIFVHTNPVAFSNYYLLRGNQKYAANTFSYIDPELLLWDDFKKSGRKVVTSPIRFILTQASLKWAYYVTMIGIILFVIFRANREQRIIPVIEPLENSSVEFAKTVGSLYYQHKDFKDITHKKSTYFLAFLRNRYHLDTSKINERMIKDLAAKSGKSLSETKTLLEFIIHLKQKPSHTDQDSIRLNKLITEFKK
mgnify:FL=1